MQTLVQRRGLLYNQFAVSGERFAAYLSLKNW